MPYSPTQTRQRQVQRLAPPNQHRQLGWTREQQGPGWNQQRSRQQQQVVQRVRPPAVTRAPDPIYGDYPPEDYDEPQITGRSAIAMAPEYRKMAVEQPDWYEPPVQRRTRAPQQTEPVPEVHIRPGTRRQWHPMVYIGITAIAVIAIFATYNMVSTWWQNHQTDAIYGYPRKQVVVANVGHGDPTILNGTSTFTVINDSGDIWVWEIPSGDPNAHPPMSYHITRITGTDADKMVATLSFVDINHDGKVDMEVLYNNSETIFYNNGKTFVNKL